MANPPTTEEEMLAYWAKACNRPIRTLHRVPEYMHEGVLRYVVRGIEPGSFLMAIFQDKFIEAWKTADEENTQCMRAWAELLYADCPMACRGSSENVAAWIHYGGLYGKMTMEE